MQNYSLIGRSKPPRLHLCGNKLTIILHNVRPVMNCYNNMDVDNIYFKNESMYLAMVSVCSNESKDAATTAIQTAHIPAV